MIDLWPAVNPDAVHDHGEPTGQDGLFHPAGQIRRKMTHLGHCPRLLDHGSLLDRVEPI